MRKSKVSSQYNTIHKHLQVSPVAKLRHLFFRPFIFSYSLPHNLAFSDTLILLSRLSAPGIPSVIIPVPSFCTISTFFFNRRTGYR
jgi:hypothetical protein